jgi:hypothetical protein
VGYSVFFASLAKSTPLTYQPETPKLARAFLCWLSSNFIPAFCSWRGSISFDAPTPANALYP